MTGDALADLAGIGKFRHTPYPGVLIGTINTERFDCDAKSALVEWYRNEPQLFRYLNRATPVEATTRFERDDVTEALCVPLEDRAAELCGQCFYVRVNLRGLKGRVESQACERALGSFLVEQSRAHGEPAEVRFDDADLVVAVEVIGNRAGFAVLDRELRSIELVRPR
jgi:tRNA(Ser,Leu) C12 N-acetylase TAN1